MLIATIIYRDPLTVFGALASKGHAIFLDSAIERAEDCWSVIAFDPSGVLHADHKHVYLDNVQLTTGPFEALQNILNSYDLEKPGRLDHGLPGGFGPGLFGYLGYDLGSRLERLPSPREGAPDLPTLVMGIYETIAVFHTRSQKAWVISQASNAEDKVLEWSTLFQQALPLPSLENTKEHVLWRPEFSRLEAETRIRQVISYIEAGDIFQANFSQRFEAVRPPGLSDTEIYRHLRDISPSPMAALLRCGNMSLASASPERFLKLTPDRLIHAFPIKGTRRRDKNPERDAELKKELSQSEKDHAENLMIVDLMRNDLSRVADLGSVDVPALCKAETFASVHHLVSEVTARLRPGLTVVDLLRATFPGGSITGAPKIRAMEIIHELETKSRGPYCGCLGWIGFDGAMDMSMTIRTLTLTADTIIAQAGGGIVADSDPRLEYEECMTKVAPLLKAVGGKEFDDKSVVEWRAAG